MFKEGNVIEVNYTAKEKDSGAVFDTTVKKEAEKAGIFNEKVSYTPKAIVLGENELLPGLEKVVKEMGVGEEKHVELNAEEGFGERKAELIRVVPIMEFTKQKMNPFPGLIVEVNNAQGKVQTVSGGRVRIDFNHPLAGKSVEYDLKVEKEIKGEGEILDVLLEKYLAFVEKGKYSYSVKKEKISVKGKKVEKKGEEKPVEGKYLELEVNDKEKLPMVQGIKPYLERKIRTCTGIERIEVKEAGEKKAVKKVVVKKTKKVTVKKIKKK